MKRSKIRLVLVGLVVLFLMSGAGAFAADNDSIILTGTVDSILSLAITEQGSYNALTLTADGIDVGVADVVVECNDPDGYTVTMEILNGTDTTAFFKGADAQNSETLVYTVKYGPASSETAVTFSAGSSEVESTSARSTVGGDTRNILISWTAPGTPLAADTYSDTLTLTIAAK